MPVLDITGHRQYNQRIAKVKFNRPSEAVAWLGAIQAQDYLNAKWAVGLRCYKATDASIEQAIADKSIIRTWLLRGTLHFVAAADIRWMLALLAPRLIAQGARRNRELKLDAATFANSFAILIDVLEGSKQATRSELMLTLEREGISTSGQRGYHILGRAALEGLICFGPYRGKEQTFVRLDEWAPPGPRMHRNEALAELARRYFTGHGPATLQDFIGWSGLAAAEARSGLELIKDQLHLEVVGDQKYWLKQSDPIARDPSPTAYLLPGFDEYFLGYSDRRAILDSKYDKRLVSSNGVFRPMLVIDGRVAGVWKRELKKASIIVTLKPFEALTQPLEQALRLAASQYGEFLGLPVVLVTE